MPRKSTAPNCNFNLGMTINDFEFIVTTIAKSNDRIEKVNVIGSQVRVTVKSLTGLSSWKFSLNFDDNGFSRANTTYFPKMTNLMFHAILQNKLSEQYILFQT